MWVKDGGAVARYKGPGSSSAQFGVAGPAMPERVKAEYLKATREIVLRDTFGAEITRFSIDCPVIQANPAGYGASGRLRLSGPVIPLIYLGRLKVDVEHYRGDTEVRDSYIFDAGYYWRA